MKAELFCPAEPLIAIGASTGGTDAIRDLLLQLPADMPGIMVVQHMPQTFTRAFAARLDSVCCLSVKPAEHGETLRRSHVYIAPGEAHLSLRRRGAGHAVELLRQPPVNRHRPSVDVLFHAVARSAGAAAIGVILTGMGKDGAAGMLAMRRAGAWTIAQHEKSCVVFGMPREAISIGAIDEVLPLPDIAAAILRRIAATRLQTA
ncbi:MAG: chemotaxis protein CheB [Burkholderiales bacterium]|nr:chemotaxis protein CheB [Burkholderiales bacterium]